MFILVTYPWPVASAHVELTGPQPPPGTATSHRDAADDTIEQRAQHVDEMVRWTGPERLRFRWYLRRVAIADARRRSPQTSVRSRVTKR